MTFADSSAHCLARLFSSTILYCNIVIWSRPCLSLIAPCLKNAFICEDEMPAIAYDLINPKPTKPLWYNDNVFYIFSHILETLGTLQHLQIDTLWRSWSYKSWPSQVKFLNYDIFNSIKFNLKIKKINFWLSINQDITYNIIKRVTT